LTAILTYASNVGKQDVVEFSRRIIQNNQRLTDIDVVTKNSFVSIKSNINSDGKSELFDAVSELIKAARAEGKTPILAYLQKNAPRKNRQKFIDDTLKKAFPDLQSVSF
jgi:hypothetical protein